MRYYKARFNVVRPLLKIRDTWEMNSLLFKELSPAEFLVACGKYGIEPATLQDETYKFVATNTGPR